MSQPPRLDHAAELMDVGPYHPGEIVSNLADLRLFNLRFGGIKLMRREVARMLEQAGWPRRVSLLDVATGSADIPAALVRWAAGRGVELHAQALDIKDDILSEARRYLGNAAPRLSLLRGEATRLPCRDGSVDLVICSNFLHHLDEDEMLQALSEMRRVARRGVIAVDLRRGRLSWTLVWILTRLTPNRLTRHDGPLSVRRAYSRGELRAMAARAGMHGAVVRPAGPARMALAWQAAAPGETRV
ncbi:MAG: methyltransferase domain-containing protein [Candidatus Polarisedimenticolia bacterium]